MLTITEEHNKNIPKQVVLKEKMNKYIEGIPDYLPNRNGGISIYAASGGGGKTNLLMGLFRDNKLYKGKFHHVYYIIPECSFLSLENSPFKKHDKVYHDLTAQLLEDIFNELKARKVDNDDDDEQEYSCVIIDDFADLLKRKDIEKQLNRMLIKARHLCCNYIFTLQSYLYYPKMLRKQVTDAIIFKTKNKEEFEVIGKELLHMNKNNALQLSEYVFDRPYNHLRIDTTNGDIYKNWNLLKLGEKEK